MCRITIHSQRFPLRTNRDFHRHNLTLLNIFSNHLTDFTVGLFHLGTQKVTSRIMSEALLLDKFVALGPLTSTRTTYLVGRKVLKSYFSFNHSKYVPSTKKTFLSVTLILEIELTSQGGRFAGAKK
jgi:hypothetical protein